VSPVSVIAENDKFAENMQKLVTSLNTGKIFQIV